MKITRKRILALNLAFLMLLTLLLPVSAADETENQDLVSITINTDGGYLYTTGEQVDTVTFTAERGERIDLLNYCYKVGAYLDYFEDENQTQYRPTAVTADDMTLTAHWKTTECKKPIVFYPNQPDTTPIVVDGDGEWTVPDMTGYVNSDGTVETTFICWENEISGRWTTLLPGQTQPAADRPVSYRASYLSDQTGIIFCAGDETFAGNDGKSWLVVLYMDSLLGKRNRQKARRMER